MNLCGIMAKAGAGQRSKLVFWHIIKAWNSLPMPLFHINRIFGCHDVVVCNLHLCRYLKSKLMKNK